MELAVIDSRIPLVTVGCLRLNIVWRGSLTSFYFLGQLEYKEHKREYVASTQIQV
jgi:hypothetical protein